MSIASSGRIPAIDMIRGLAILGILAVNLEGFAGPITATLTPDWNGPAAFADHLAFAAVMVLFEGKMRALLSLLFGAGMTLFIESAQANGHDGDILQLRRLGWLAMLGYLHFALLWWGDILFTYAFAGALALLLRHFPTKAMVPAALLAFSAWHGAGMASSIAPILAEARLEARASAPAERAQLLHERDTAKRETLAEMQREQGGWLPLVQYKMVHEADLPLSIALNTLGETLPLMLIGMALHHSGFFNGGWSRARLKFMALSGIGCGGGLTLALTTWAWSRGFPPVLMSAILGWWMAVPHLIMGLGYAAMLVLWADGARDSRLAIRASAVGRMALSNYLASTLVMTGIFYGWGLGMIGELGERWYWPFVVGGWAAMLWVSPLWLRTFRQGPVEWLWRSLTLGRWLPFRRPTTPHS